MYVYRNGCHEYVFGSNSTVFVTVTVSNFQCDCVSKVDVRDMKIHFPRCNMLSIKNTIYIHLKYSFYLSEPRGAKKKN